MFGLGMGELLVILVIALLFLGPKRLPDVATSLGKAIRSFRKATNELSEQLEVDDTVTQPLRELKAALRDEPAPLSVQRPAATTAAAPAAPTHAPGDAIPAAASAVPGPVVSNEGGGSGEKA